MDAKSRGAKSFRLYHHIKLFILLLLIQRTLSESPANDEFDDELYQVIHSVREGTLWTMPPHSRSARSVSFSNYSEPSIWSELLDECSQKTNFACVRVGMFKYLDRNLEVRGDVPISETVSFRSNGNKYQGVCENSLEERERCARYYEARLNLLETTAQGNDVTEKSDKVGESTAWTTPPTGPSSTEPSEDDEDVLENESRDLHGMADVTDILYDKGTQFLMTHDLELDLPQTFFGGGSIKLEPKSFVQASEDEEEGVMVKMVFKPPPETSVGSGRFLFHLKKLFKKKLMHSFMALLLIIKMIKVKLMFLLPMVVGQSTAKKLLLKVLLFLIPGLAHLFKLCHYYHMEHAKYHHHHHKIKHHHHHVQVPVPVPVPVPVHGHHPHHGPHVHQHNEPTIHHLHEDQGYPPFPPSHHSIGAPLGPPVSSNEEYDYPPAGGGGHNGGYGGHGNGGGGGGYNRNENNPYPSITSFNDNEAAMTSWGLGSGSNYHETGVLDAKDQPMYYNDEKSVFKKSPAVGAYYPNANEYNTLYKQQQHKQALQLLTPRPPSGVVTIPVVYDPFYSPILQKIDNIFVQLGFNEEACRERLVCSMYKNPHRYSPHSNLISAELSRDSSELQRPSSHNSAVVRFYKYVQAARDGQEQKDCIRLYASCTVNTEK